MTEKKKKALAIEIQDGGSGFHPIGVKDAHGDLVARFSYKSDAEDFISYDDLVNDLVKALQSALSAYEGDWERGSSWDKKARAALAKAGVK